MRKEIKKQLRQQNIEMTEGDEDEESSSDSDEFTSLN